MSSSKILVFLISSLVVNLICLDFVLYYFWQNPPWVSVSVNTQTQEACPSKCTDLINTAVSTIPSPACNCSIVAPSSAKIVSVPSKTKSTVYIPIPGSGSTLENNWVNLPGTEFNFNTEDHPGLKEVYFEANMKLFNGNGKAFLRLFDITAGIEVWGGNVETSSQNFTSVISGKMTIRPGSHLYRVQAKSLTADTTVFNSGRLKLILEN